VPNLSLSAPPAAFFFLTLRRPTQCFVSAPYLRTVPSPCFSRNFPLLSLIFLFLFPLPFFMELPLFFNETNRTFFSGLKLIPPRRLVAFTSVHSGAE